ncbi:hypothetical protein CSOJ01_12488 [Colletotrichum sojae]|uniref:Rhodopsin domain-containing protein n=1 Tax=Colletotrichum sojae TaxID=2175907 RepID=A0A8H6IUW7_9PEZI|nr:hypothetical protein CSOJ01_12488 [Colletotrichum sojae]
MDGATLHEMMGGYDNSGEPQPLVNKKATILGVVIAFATFSWLCVGFRLYTRARLVRSMGWDDVFVICSLLSTISASTAISFGPRYGMGKHIYELSAQQVQNYLRTFYIANALYQMSTAFIKISLLFQYLRIFDQPCFLRRLCIGLIVFVSLWGLTYSILAWVPCWPIRAYWDWSVVAERWAYGSLNSEVFSATYESHSSVNVFLDLVVLAIPVPLYFRPNAPLKSRLGLLALLGIGIAVNAVSIVRLITIVQHRSATVPTLDPMWYGPISIVLSAVEIDLAMVASSVPIFWPVLRDAFPGIFVTKEIEVTREVRRLESVEIDDDGMELEPDCHRRSRVGSEASLRQEAGAKSPVSHGSGGRRYLDDYVVGHVDPLRRSKSVVTQVKAEAGWWQSKGQDV